MSGDRWESVTDGLLAAAAGLVALVAYMLTLTPTVPFWDSGEFIATSYILGIPHPPGTPLYVLLGRVFCLLPIADTIAERVNMLSAIPSAVAVSLTYLVTARVLAGFGEPFSRASSWPPRPALISRLGAVVAALVMAFSFTYWNNAIEAEVYALSSMVMVLCVYLMLKWRDLRHLGGEHARHASNIVVLVFYMLALSVAFHMGAFIVFLPLVLYFLSDYYPNLRDPRFVISACCILLLSFCLGFDQTRILISCCLILGLMVVNGDVAGWRNFMALASAILLLAIGGYLVTNVGPVIGLLITAALGATVYWFAASSLVRNNLGFWVAIVFVLGLSVHVFLLIRAGLSPAINEADPSTLENFWLVISRDQYKPGPPWDRRGDVAAAFVTHFWRYWRWQYDAGVDVLWAAPFALGLWGAITNFLRSKRTFLLLAFIMLVTSIGLIWHLNFRADEVRDRDYFFVALFHFFAIWIGIGVSGIIYMLREAVAPGAARIVVTVVAGSAFLAFPLGQMRAGWFEHDRTGFYVARDYAYNILEPLEQDAIIFTNGDNDTFPLWYLQEVEGIRKDVRVANLSLLNTGWYIKQLRDEEPRAPIQWDDAEIDGLLPFRDARTGVIYHVRDMAVEEMVRANRWRKPLYIAVTVPDLMGFDEPGRNRLVMEGLAWRINPTLTEEAVDIEKVRENLEDVFSWRGLLDENGKLDRSIHRDENTMKLVGNYAAAHIRLAMAYTDRSRDLQAEGQYEQAEREMRLAVEQLERAEELRDGFSTTGMVLGSLYHTLGEHESAESLYTDMLNMAFVSDDPAVIREIGQLIYQRGEVRYSMRRFEEARSDFELLIQQGYNQWPAVSGLVRSLSAEGRVDEALGELDEWLAANPGHAEALEFRERLQGALP